MPDVIFEQGYRLSRRALLAASLAGAGALLLHSRPGTAQAAAGLRHLVWTWQFSSDGAPNLLAARLRDTGLGMLLKTHDGIEWMSKYDKSPFAVSGPAQVGVLANYFETAGVPFHAWTVVTGVDPIKEARMAADVLANGARSLYLDVEPHSGFWAGTPQGALDYGRELRRLQPNARIVLSLDPRPWVIQKLPMQEFVSFSNEIAPQQYWRSFNTSANYERFAQSGFPVPPEGVTPEFLVEVGKVLLNGYGLPVTQVGQGATPDHVEFERFISAAYAAGSQIVSAWRYGVTTDPIFGMLRDTPPYQPKIVAAATFVHVVKAGETLGKIAETYGVGIDAILQANALTDPNYIYEGQELVIPGVNGTAAAGSTASSGSGSSATGGAAAKTYVVEAGDTLYGIAARFNTSVDAIVKLNNLSDPSSLSIGQELKIPQA